MSSVTERPELTEAEADDLLERLAKRYQDDAPDVARAFELAAQASRESEASNS